jgi:hypothetical protein
MTNAARMIKPKCESGRSNQPREPCSAACQRAPDAPTLSVLDARQACSASGPARIYLTPPPSMLSDGPRSLSSSLGCNRSPFPVRRASFPVPYGGARLDRQFGSSVQGLEAALAAEI